MRWWNCFHCGAENEDWLSNCEVCGWSRKESDEARDELKRREEEDKRKADEAVRIRVAEDEKRKEEADKAKRAKEDRKKREERSKKFQSVKCSIIIFVALVLLPIVIIICSITLPTPVLDLTETLPLTSDEKLNPVSLLLPEYSSVIWDRGSEDIGEVQVAKKIVSTFGGLISRLNIQLSNLFGTKEEIQDSAGDIGSNSEFYIITETGEVTNKVIGLVQRYGKSYNVYYERTLDFPYETIDTIKTMSLMNVNSYMVIEAIIIPDTSLGNENAMKSMFSLTDSASNNNVPNIAYGTIHKSSATSQEYAIFTQGNHLLSLSGRKVSVHLLVYGT